VCFHVHSYTDKRHIDLFDAQKEHYLQSSEFFGGKEMCQCWRPEGLAFFKEHVENR